MGSFNTSCFASHQTIAPREKCYVIPIIQRHGFDPVDVTHEEKTTQEWGLTDSTCYPNGFWRVLSGFIEATYNDYGRVLVTNTPRNAYLLFHLFSTLYKSVGVVAQGNNPYHDVPYNLPQFIAEKTPLLHTMLGEKGSNAGTPDRDALFEELVKVWDYTWEVAQEQRLFAASRNGGGLRPVQFAVLHTESYTRLVDIASQGHSWDGTPFEPRARVEALLKKATAEMDEFFAEELKDLMAEHNAGPTEELSRELAELEISKRLMTVSQFFEGFSRIASFESGFSLLEMGLRPKVKQHFENKLSLDEFFEKILPFLKDRYAMNALESLNLHLTPMVYTTQDYSNDIGTAYTRFVQEVSRAVNLGRDRDEEDDEGEDNEADE